MLSRAGQSVLRPRTPSTPTLQTVPAPFSPASQQSPAGADAVLASLAEGSASLGQPLSGPEAAANDVVVRRRPSGFVGSQARRRLTVDCGKRLIQDFIDNACQQETTTEKTCKSRQHPAQAIQTPGAVLSVWGSATTETDKFVPYFAQKPMNFDGELSTMKHRIGIMSHRGYKPESPNQDDFFVLARSDSLLLGVLDGHGPEGHDVSHFAQERLPTYVMERLRQDPEAWEEAVSSAVKDLCTRAKEEVGNKAEYSGSTVTIVMLDQPGGFGGGRVPRPLRLRCAFLGDSIAVVARRSGQGGWEVTQLTQIHRPDREDELQRIELAGGSVRIGLGSSPSRLLTPEWNLAMSRSFGDFHAVKYGLSNEIEISQEVTLEPDADTMYLVLACSDGVWDVIPPAQAVQFVGRFKPEEAQLAVERLVSKAQRRWQETEDVVDDITAILVWPGFGTDEEEDDEATSTGP